MLDGVEGCLDRPDHGVDLLARLLQRALDLHAGRHPERLQEVELRLQVRQVLRQLIADGADQLDVQLDQAVRAGRLSALPRALISDDVARELQTVFCCAPEAAGRTYHPICAQNGAVPPAPVEPGGTQQKSRPTIAGRTGSHK
jgi:hypothetical protein